MSANGAKYGNSEADQDAATRRRRRRRRRHTYKRRLAVRGRQVSRDKSIESTRVRTSSSLRRERGDWVRVCGQRSSTSDCLCYCIRLVVSTLSVW